MGELNNSKQSQTNLLLTFFLQKRLQSYEKFANIPNFYYLCSKFLIKTYNMKRIYVFVASLLLTLTAFGQAKYIFYMIGDGMGPNEVLAAEMYLAELKEGIGRKQLCMTQFPFSGQAATFSSSNSITDSSAAGTCLATGKKTNNGTLGLDSEGNPLKTIAEVLKNNGWAIGITTSVSIDHATPAAFYAKSASRNDYFSIGCQLAESNFDFFGGASFYQPTDPSGEDNRNVYDLCRQNDYKIAHGYKEYEEMREAKKLILIQAKENQSDEQPGFAMIPYQIDSHKEDLSLAQITDAAIDFLSTKDMPFFLMVEGGAIDWACHGNDGATVIKEVLSFDRAIRSAFKFYQAHPDETLIVVTADHETGGMALGNSDYTLNLQALQYQKASAGKISDQIKDLHEQYGKKLKWSQVKEVFISQLGLYREVSLSDEEDAALQASFKTMMKNKDKDSQNMYASLNAISNQAVQLLNKKAKVGWTTKSHSAAAVPVFAIGVGAEQFSGWHDNSEIMPLLLKMANQQPTMQQNVPLPKENIQYVPLQIR